MLKQRHTKDKSTMMSSSDTQTSLLSDQYHLKTSSRCSYVDHHYCDLPKLCPCQYQHHCHQWSQCQCPSCTLENHPNMTISCRNVDEKRTLSERNYSSESTGLLMKCTKSQYYWKMYNEFM